jgi:hypothetical protein
MNTFLPYPDFERSAACLDRQRLGKQRVECLQVLNALLGSGGWRHHPAVKMWRGFEPALAAYGVAVCDEWLRRGYRDTCKAKIRALVEPDASVLPPWFGDPHFHASHRSNLLRKFPEHYSQFGWTETNDLPYVWPEVAAVKAILRGEYD